MRFIKVQALVTVIAISLLFSLSCTQPANPTEHPPEAAIKAAIIDQLYSLQPNKAFMSKVTQELEAYGFEVDVYQADDVTVALYQSLPGLGYKLILFRAHSGLLSGEEGVINKTCLFTNEPYSETRYVQEQLRDQLAKGRIDKDHPFVFTMRDKFVTQAMDGAFNNTVIIMMGCSCLFLDDLAQAFIAKGASSYMGWDATVDLGYVDGATPYLLQQLCQENLTVKDAVKNTMSAKGRDPKYGAVLKYYPQESGDTTLKQLTG